MRQYTNLHDGGPQLQVSLVHLGALSHVDLQIVPDQSEESCGEGNPAFLVDRHVHPDQSLVGHLVRTLLPESQRRINILQHLQGFCIVNLPPT